MADQAKEEAEHRDSPLSAMSAIGKANQEEEGSRS